MGLPAYFVPVNKTNLEEKRTFTNMTKPLTRPVMFVTFFD